MCTQYPVFLLCFLIKRKGTQSCSVKINHFTASDLHFWAPAGCRRQHSHWWLTKVLQLTAIGIKESLTTTRVQTGKCNLPATTLKCLMISVVHMRLHHHKYASVYTDVLPLHRLLIGSASFVVPVTRAVKSSSELMTWNSHFLTKAAITLRPIWSCELCDSPVWMLPKIGLSARGGAKRCSATFMLSKNVCDLFASPKCVCFLYHKNGLLYWWCWIGSALMHHAWYPRRLTFCFTVTC